MKMTIALALLVVSTLANAQVAGPPVGGSGLCSPQQVLTPSGWVTVIVCR